MDLSEFSDLLNKKSGLKGLCGITDMRSINLAIDTGDESAKLAKAVFVHRARKFLGSYLLQLAGKVDVIIFTGGIAENDATIRKEVTLPLPLSYPSNLLLPMSPSRNPSFLFDLMLV